MKVKKKVPSTGQPPKKLSERHRLAAFLLATGQKKGWIAKKIGVDQAYFSVIQTSPLFRLMVKEYQNEIIAKGMQSTVDKVMTDGPSNVDFIMSVRNGLGPVGDIEDPNDQMRHRMKASEMLFDRQMVKKQENQEGVHVNITVEAAQRTTAEDACAEVGEPIDITPTKRLTGPLVARPLDELIDEYEARDSVEV